MSFDSELYLTVNVTGKAYAAEWRCLRLLNKGRLNGRQRRRLKKHTADEVRALRRLCLLP